MSDRLDNLADKLQNELDVMEQQRRAEEAKADRIYKRKEQIAAKKQDKQRYRDALRFVAACRPGPHLKADWFTIIFVFSFASAFPLAFDVFTNETASGLRRALEMLALGIIPIGAPFLLKHLEDVVPGKVGTHFLGVNKKLIHLYKAYLQKYDIAKFANQAAEFYQTSKRSKRTLDNMIQEVGQRISISKACDVLKADLNPRVFEMFMRGVLRNDKNNLQRILVEIPLEKIPNSVLENLPYAEQKKYLIEFIRNQQKQRGE